MTSTDPTLPGSTSTSTSTSTASPGTGPSATDESTGEPPKAPFDVVAFSADWSTPESIHWTWDVEGAAEDFHAWTLWLATDETALENGEAVLVFDGNTNPELDRFVLKNTSGIDPVVATLTRGLQPSTTYFARLFVFDTAGGRTQSSNVAVRSTTLEPNAQRVLFEDNPLDGGAYPLPVCFERTDAAPYVGTHHFALALRCDTRGVQTCTSGNADVAECWENLRLEGLAVSLVDLGGGDFTDAFLEFHLAIDADPLQGHGWWSTAALFVGDTSFSISPLTFPADGTYHRFQIPLSWIGVTLEALQDPIRSFRVGSQWQNGSQLRLDTVRIRW